MATDIKKTKKRKMRPVSEPALEPVKKTTLTKYSEKAATAIIEAICEGKMLTDICRLDGTPSPPAVRQWTVENPEFGKRFDQARAMQADVLFEEAVTIGRTSLSGAADRLRVDTLMKAAAIFQPKKYGDKKEVSNVVAVNIHTTLGMPDAKVITTGPYIVETTPTEAN